MGNLSDLGNDLKKAGQAVEAFAGAVVDRVKLMSLLAAYEKAPPSAIKAARDMTPQEAFDNLMHLVFKGEVVLGEPIRTDKAGKVISPRPGQQFRVGTRIAGVDYFRASAKGFEGNHAQKYFEPNPAFAIVLHRLAKFLGGQYWGATRIVWGGIGHGADGKSLNCHEIGTCMDFYGAITSRGTFDVLANWGEQPVTLADGTTPKSQAGDLWGTTTRTFYRLRPFDHGQAYWFFAAVYKFATEECTVGAADASPLSFFTGQHLSSGTIIHPDYPNLGLRRTHQEHMHIQLGAAYV